MLLFIHGRYCFRGIERNAGFVRHRTDVFKIDNGVLICKVKKLARFVPGQFVCCYGTVQPGPRG